MLEVQKYKKKRAMKALRRATCRRTSCTTWLALSGLFLRPALEEYPGEWLLCVGKELSSEYPTWSGEPSTSTSPRATTRRWGSSTTRYSSRSSTSCSEPGDSLSWASQSSNCQSRTGCSRWPGSLITNLLEFFESRSLPEPPLDHNSSAISRIFYGRLYAGEWLFKSEAARGTRSCGMS